MFWKGKRKNRCNGCNNIIEQDWAFCPRCGGARSDDAAPLPEALRRKRNESDEEDDIFGFPAFAGFDDVLRHMEQQMQGMDKMFSEPLFRVRRVGVPRSSGISISISSATGRQPKISVHTFGDARKLEPKIKRQLGVREGVAEIEEGHEKPVRPRITAEPEMKAVQEDGRFIYTINIPDVRYAKDIQVKRLPNSIEVRARAGDKLYFKLFEAQSNLSVLEKKFTGGKLTLVLG